MLGAEPPHQFVYELFLDDKGEKISKTKGNGISVEQWLAYAPDESLSLYQWQKPKHGEEALFRRDPEGGRRIPDLPRQISEARRRSAQLENPVWHIHGGKPPAVGSPVSFAMLLNLVSAANASNKDVLWGFIRREAPDATPEKYPLLDRLVRYALAYYADFVKPAKTYRAPNDKERAALEDLAARLEGYDGTLDGEALQTLVFAVGTEHAFEPLRDWFKAIYEVCLGQSQGPRFGGVHRALWREGNGGADPRGARARLVIGQHREDYRDHERQPGQRAKAGQQSAGLFRLAGMDRLNANDRQRQQRGEDHLHPEHRFRDADAGLGRHHGDAARPEEGEAHGGKLGVGAARPARSAFLLARFRFHAGQRYDAAEDARGGEHQPDEVQNQKPVRHARGIRRGGVRINQPPSREAEVSALRLSCARRSAPDRWAGCR